MNFKKKKKKTHKGLFDYVSFCKSTSWPQFFFFFFFFKYSRPEHAGSYCDPELAGQVLGHRHKLRIWVCSQHVTGFQKTWIVRDSSGEMGSYVFGDWLVRRHSIHPNAFRFIFQCKKQVTVKRKRYKHWFPNFQPHSLDFLAVSTCSDWN